MKSFYIITLIFLSLMAGCGDGPNVVDCEGPPKEIRDLGTYGEHETLVICKNGVIKKLR